MNEKLTILSFRGIIFLVLVFFLLYSPVTDAAFPLAIFGLLGAYFLSDLALLWVPAPKFAGSRLLPVLFLFDTVFISWFIYATQGWHTDIYLVYFIVVFMSGMQINIRQSFLVGTVAGLLYLALWTNLNPREELLNTALLLRLPFFYIISFFTAFFAQQVQEQKRLFEEFATDSDKTRELLADKLGVARSRQEAFFNNIPDMAWLKDKENRFIAVNESFGKFCGLRPADLVGKTDSDIWPPPLAEKYRADDAEVMRSGKRKCTEEAFEDADKRACWLETIRMPISDNTGAVTGTIGIARDITAHKRAKEERDGRIRDLDFLSAVAMESVELPLEKDIYAFAAEKLKLLVGDSVIAVSRYDKGSNTLFPRVLLGLGKHADGVVKLLGRSPLDMFFEIPCSETKLEMITSALAKFPEGLYDLFFGQVPRVACAAVEKLLNTDGAYGIGLRRGEHLFGTILIMPRRGTELRRNIIETFVNQVSVILERNQTHGERLEVMSEAAAVIECMPDALVELDLKGTILRVNLACAAMFGAKTDGLIGSRYDALQGIAPDDHEKIGRLLERLTETGCAEPVEIVFRREDAGELSLSVNCSLTKDSHGARKKIIAVLRDITELKRTEAERSEILAQLLHSQKLEAVGRLAGGVAHDFNNIMGAIIGYAEFLRDGLSPQDPKLEDVREILKAADRATVLTRQLTAFSRRQILSPRILDLNLIIGEMSSMLRRLISEDVQLVVKPSAPSCPVRVDPGQIEQVIMNLAVNARDAMPKGGALTLETGLISPDTAFFEAHPDLQRGPLVRLTVSDTGTGMSDEVKSHLFEPFYTTKERGKGSGLGLSMVLGIVKQSGGEIIAESSPDTGTVFCLYFPCAEGAMESNISAKDSVKPKGPLAKTRKTILMADDDETLLRVTARFLRDSGYIVLTVSGGKEALELLEGRRNSVDLLLTDIVMPGMSGRELALEVEHRKRSAKTLYMSGHADDAIVSHGMLEPGLEFISKPFSREELLLKVRSVLDAPAASGKA